jgi:tetratricopeptide (TPR) repeat protein
MSLHARQYLSTLALTLLTTIGFAQSRSGPACTNAAQHKPDITAARAALQRTPSALATRLNLAGLLYKTECYDDAIHVLEEGEKYNPHNAYLQYYLNRAHNMQKGEQYLEGLDKAEAAGRLSRNKLRCTRFGDLAACDAVLKEQPDNAEIMSAKADALAKEDRTGEAIAVYTRAAELAPNNNSVAAKLQSLKSQRQALLKRCAEGNGDAALQACMASLEKGAPNEFDITLRIAILEQSTNQPLQALDSYIAANSLRHGNKEVALAILALLDSTKRKDAVALAARGSSLVVLGRAGEAIAPLRQAYALAPDLPDISRQIATAEALARAQSAARKETQPRIAAANLATEAVAEAVPEPKSFSNAAPASRSN